MARIPRPLLVAVLVLVLLGAVSCAAGGMKGPSDFEQVDIEFDPEPIAASEIDATGNCTRLDAEITVTTNCDLIVPAQEFPPRELRLRVTGGSGTASVVQKIRGKVRTPKDEELVAGRQYEVSAAGEGDIVLRVVCAFGCRLRIVR